MFFVLYLSYPLKQFPNFNFQSARDFYHRAYFHFLFTFYVFAEKAGVALTVIRKIDQGKENLNLSKLNQVLLMFGHEVGPVSINHETSN